MAHFQTHVFCVSDPPDPHVDISELCILLGLVAVQTCQLLYCTRKSALVVLDVSFLLFWDIKGVYI